MDKVEVKWINDDSSASQIYNSGIQYAFASDDFRQCFPFVYCKDFLQDAVYANLHHTKASIYGFTYDAKKMPALCMSMTRVMVTNQQDNEMRSKVAGAIDFINQFCKLLKLKRTQVFEAINPPKKYAGCGVYLFDGSSMWMNSPVLVSMYSLLLRAGFSHEKGAKCMDTVDGIIGGKISNYQKYDRTQLGGALPTIKKFIKHGYRKYFYIDPLKNYPVGTDIYTMHDCCGVVGFSSESAKQVVPYWHRKSLKKLDKKAKEGANNGKV